MSTTAFEIDNTVRPTVKVDRTSSGRPVLDATRLAPRPTLARIATGRDAADTAFATTLRGDVELLGTEIHASTDTELPRLQRAVAELVIPADARALGAQDLAWALINSPAFLFNH